MNTRTCPHCKQDLPLDQFYRRKDYPEKFVAWCKACLRWNSQRYLNSAQGKANTAEYRKSESRRQALLRYNVSDKRIAVSRRYYLSGKQQAKEEAYKEKPEYWIRKRVRGLAYAALRRGEISRYGCEFFALGDCHGRIEMHHDDYAKPLEVRWLCARHHKQLERGRII